jgi:hypothetical protein
LEEKRMKLVELAFFTENEQEMTDFYRRLLNAEPVPNPKAW